jgi:hypothetical protein
MEIFTDGLTRRYACLAKIHDEINKNIIATYHTDTFGLSLHKNLEHGRLI